MPIGVDEAGRGPVLGPLVVAALYVESEDVLSGLGVADSKALTPQRRERVAEELGGRSRHHIVIVTADEIDAWREHRSLNALEVDMFGRAVGGLLREAGLSGKEDPLYLDAADVDEARFGLQVGAKLSELGFDGLKPVAKHKADSLFPVVSAASVVAKVRRDAEVRLIEDAAGANVGSGYPSDPATIEYIRYHLSSHGDLPPHTRRSWETARKLMDSHRFSTPSLDSF
jgi:ribonuclease HII